MRGGKKLLPRLALMVAGVVLLDLCARFVFGFTEHPAGQAAATIAGIADELNRPAEAFDAQQGEEAEEGELTRFPHPYYGWGARWTQDKLPRLLEKSRARGDEYEILLVGGSVAGNFYRDGRDEFTGILERDPRLAGREINLVGLGRAAFKQPQQLNLIMYCFSLGWRPDAVINLDGFNEVALGNQNASKFKVHPLHPAYAQWGPMMTMNPLDRDSMGLLLDVRAEQVAAGRLAKTTERWGLTRSALLGRLVVEKMFGYRARHNDALAHYMQLTTNRARRTAFQGPDYDHDFEAAMELSIRGWAESSRSLNGACEERSIFYLHVLQPTLHDEGSKPLAPNEIEHGGASDEWLDGVHYGYPRLRQEGRDLRADGVRFVDASLVFEEAEQPLYFDACHFGPEGNLILARRIAEAFLEDLP